MTSPRGFVNLHIDSSGWPSHEPETYRCPYCSGEFFGTVESYSSHICRTHKIDPSTGRSLDFSPGKCEPLEANAKSDRPIENQGNRCASCQGSHVEANQLTGASDTGDYAHHVCDSPQSERTPDTSDYEESMHNNVEYKTPSPAPRATDSQGATTADQIGRLSLDNIHSSAQSRRDRDILDASPATASKRAASSELHGPSTRRSPAGAGFRQSKAGGLRHQRTPRSPRKGNVPGHQSHAAHYSSRPGTTAHGSGPYHRAPTPKYRKDGGPSHPLPRDSGYDTFPSRGSTLQPDLTPIPADDEYVSVEPLSNSSRGVAKGDARQYVGSVSLLRSKSRYPGLILQPESSPISQDQLAAEVKGIYGGLVMVEAKCINIDAAQAADPNSSLGPEQWQALIALHRTLLYEHHDFLMATQHPSATPALRGLAQKYSMPARMWRHGIHAFLEVLRHRRPQSQDYMVAFVYLSYQMMALLFETVPSFTDTWIECLGDLARYRMAIEEDKEIHTIWGGVAASWYNTASDRHPSIGRLYHHLGILERPKLRKLFLYAKSLTCLIPFPNARDSLGTLCSPFVQSETSGQNGMLFAESRMLRFHAYHFIAPEHEEITSLASDAILGLDQCSATELRDTGVFIVVTNIAALFELGAPNNALWQLFGNAINMEIHASRPSAAASELHFPGSAEQSFLSPTSGSSASALIYDFSYSSFRSLTERGSNPQATKDVLRALHAMLVWLHSLHVIRNKLKTDHDLHTLSLLSTPNRFPWGGLCTALNVLCQNEPINTRVMECARQEIFPRPESNNAQPLLEDYQLRGLIWTHWYYPAGFFGDQGSDEEAHMETTSPAVHRSRVDRIQWIALCLAFHGEYIKFNDSTTSFWPTSMQEQSPLASQEAKVNATKASISARTTTPKSLSPATSSPQSDSDGYTFVEKPKSSTTKSWASVVSSTGRKEQRQDDIKVVDDDMMQWGV